MTTVTKEVLESAVESLTGTIKEQFGILNEKICHVESRIGEVESQQQIAHGSGAKPKYPQSTAFYSGVDSNHPEGLTTQSDLSASYPSYAQHLRPHNQVASQDLSDITDSKAAFNALKDSVCMLY